VRCLWCCVKGWEDTFYANLMLFRTNLSWAFTCRACIFSWNHTNFVYLFCNSKAQRCQRSRGWQLKGERASATRVRPISQHTASSLIVHPFSLCSVSHGLLAIDTNPLPWLPFSIQQPTSPHWLPICDRQSYWCFHSTIQFYHGQTSQIYAKTSFLADFSDGETRCNQSSKAHQTTH